MAAPPSNLEDGNKGRREIGDTDASLAAAFSLRARSRPLTSLRALTAAALSRLHVIHLEGFRVGRRVACP